MLNPLTDYPSSTPPQGGLGTSQVISPPPLSGATTKAQDRRSFRYSLRDSLRDFNPARIASCGLHAVSKVGVTLRVSEHQGRRVAGFAGLETCGSVWACPVCASRIASQRQQELGKVFESAHADGLTITLITLTARHNKGQKLSEVWDAITSGWKGITSGKQWYKKANAVELVGYVASTEVTHGKNGWHVHKHVAFISNTGRAEMEEFGQWVRPRWERGLNRVGFDSSDKYGVDVKVITSADVMSNGAVGRYLAKQGYVDVTQAKVSGLAGEVTQGMNKSGRKGNRTPFEIASDLFEHGDVTDALLWEEYAEASRGRRQLTWNRDSSKTMMMDLRKFYGVEERTDEDIAAEEYGSSADDVLVFDSQAWSQVRQSACTVLAIAETDGVDILKAWLTAHGIDYYLPDDPWVLRMKAEEQAEREFYSALRG